MDKVLKMLKEQADEMINEQLQDKKLRCSLYDSVAEALAKQIKDIPKPHVLLDALDEHIESSMQLKALLYRVASASKEELKAVREETCKTTTTQVTVAYRPKANEVHIDINESEIDPKYLKYILEYQNIPADAKIIYKDSKNK